MEWKKLSEEPIKAGWRKVVRKRFLLPDGEEADFDVKDEGQSVCILAITQSGRVIIASQYRPGPEKVLKELPGGGIEENETPEQAARRELLEETGHEGNFSYIGATHHCAYSSRVTHHFLATDCRKTHEPRPDACEFVDVVSMDMNAFFSHVRSGELTDTATAYKGLEHLGLLQRAWIPDHPPSEYRQLRDDNNV